MKEHRHVEDNFFWEIPEIDLHLRHYSGHPSDVIKKIKSDIEKFLSNPSLDENRTALRYDKNGNPYMVSYNIRQVYSAVYNALNYYKNISYLPSAEYETGDTFLSSSIRTFNEDYDYLAKKYNSDDPTQDPVISVSGRIKSPLSFMDKVREKIIEYIEEDRDFKYFNESLRDLIGVRFVINPPPEIQAQGLQAESDYLYKVYFDLMEHHGITYPKDLPSDNITFTLKDVALGSGNKYFRFSSCNSDKGTNFGHTTGNNGESFDNAKFGVEQAQNWKESDYDPLNYTYNSKRTNN